MTTILLLGFLMGIRHALEADHLAAVAALAARGGVRAAVVRGAIWGLGHTTTLLLVGGVCVLLNVTLPPPVAVALEIAVGALLLLLGSQVFWRLHVQRVHIHVHHHADRTLHLHAHGHSPNQAHDPAHHEHPHPAPFSPNAFFVGLVHGLAGSATLVLITLPLVESRWLGLVYIALFGGGSVLGMAVLSVVIGVPLQFSARRLTRVYRGLQTLIGFAALGLGLRIMYLGLHAILH